VNPLGVVVNAPGFERGALMWQRPEQSFIEQFVPQAVVTSGDVLMRDVRHLIEESPRKDAPGTACGAFYPDPREP
jgi:hypothetical protein